jgi:Family of unknown function (DUF6936)
MTKYNPMRELPATAGYGKGDVLVLFGELFGRGYANGIVDEAKKRGMTIIGSTVGRRASDGKLRPLNAAELAEAEALLGGTIINVPLEAGFDMTEDDDGSTPIDQMKRVRPDDWDKTRLDWDKVEQSRQRGIVRFSGAVAEFSAALAQKVTPGAHLLFVHTMAGGMPRARIYMPVFNRVFKGQGERYLSSETFWASELGRLCALSFNEVTADTFTHLVDGTSALREQLSARGSKVSYAAYGYHGCEVLINGAYTWQSYTPYLPGWAKIRLEEAAEAARSKGVTATVFNSPEIQTNSSALFMGVEISLYPLLAALEKEGGGARADAIKEECRKLLKDDASIAALLNGANDYLASPLMARFGDFASWPHHNTLEQAELMLDCSASLLAMNRDPKEIVCAALSRAVFTAVGSLMLNTMWASPAPAFWLNHDIIAKCLVSRG